MAITRLIYYSENQIDPTKSSVIKELGNILSASNRNNKPLGLTGALVFDDRWFLQVLEGDRGPVWQTLRHIEDDERHSNIVVVEAKEVPDRIFGSWWMGLATRSNLTADAFAPFLQGGVLRPNEMRADDILSLMISLAKTGLSRKLAVAA